MPDFILKRRASNFMNKLLKKNTESQNYYNYNFSRIYSNWQRKNITKVCIKQINIKVFTGQSGHYSNLFLNKKYSSYCFYLD